MPRYQSALDIDCGFVDGSEDRMMQEQIPRLRGRGRQAGVEFIGIVGKNWVVLNPDHLNAPSPAWRVNNTVESGLQKVRTLLALD